METTKPALRLTGAQLQARRIAAGVTKRALAEALADSVWHVETVEEWYADQLFNAALVRRFLAAIDTAARAAGRTRPRVASPNQTSGRATRRRAGPAEG